MPSYLSLRRNDSSSGERLQESAEDRRGLQLLCPKRSISIVEPCGQAFPKKDVRLTFEVSLNQGCVLKSRVKK